MNIFHINNKVKEVKKAERKKMKCNNLNERFIKRRKQCLFVSSFLSFFILFIVLFINASEEIHTNFLFISYVPFLFFGVYLVILDKKVFNRIYNKELIDKEKKYIDKETKNKANFLFQELELLKDNDNIDKIDKELINNILFFYKKERNEKLSNSKIVDLEIIEQSILEQQKLEIIENQ